MANKSTVLVRLKNSNKYNFVANVTTPWTDEMRDCLKVREQTSYHEDVGLDAMFFVFTADTFKAFLDRTPAEELGWSPLNHWGVDMLPEFALTDRPQNNFSLLVKCGLWELRELAGLITFEQSQSWNAKNALA